MTIATSLEKVDLTHASSQKDKTSLWHQRLGHAKFKNLSRLSRKDLDLGIPKIGRQDSLFCDDYQHGKQVKATHKKLTQIGISRPFELIHLDLAGPTRTKSLGGKRYFMVMVDDFYRYTWVSFLREKSDAFEEFKNVCMRLQTEKELSIKKIRSDHGGEFENNKFSNFCNERGIKHEFSTPKTL